MALWVIFYPKYIFFQIASFMLSFEIKSFLDKIPLMQIYKFIMAMLVSIMQLLLFDFFFFLGIKLNYLDSLEIKEYFNPFFVDNQNIVILIISFGVLVLLNALLKSQHLKIAIFLTTWAFSALSLIPFIGYFLGESIFKQENQTIQMHTRGFKGDIMYENRKYIFVHFKNSSEITKIDKERL